MNQRLVLALALALALALSGANARAATDCAVRLVPENASEPWQIAVRNVDAEARVLAPADGDCSEIVVHVVADGAWIELTTTSGGHAARHVDTPDELEATVAAMLVRLPTESDVGASHPKQPAPPPSPSPVLRGPVPALPPGGAKSTALILGLFAGVRVGWPYHFISPLVGGSAGLAFRNWEIGVFGQWEMNYASPAAPLPTGVQLWAIATGVSLSHRVPLSDGFTLVLAGHVGGAVVTEEGGETADGLGGTQSEGRVGVGIGIAAPKNSSIRIRPMLDFDMAPTRLRKSNQEIDPQLPTPPRWGISLTFALESEAI